MPEPHSKKGIVQEVCKLVVYKRNRGVIEVATDDYRIGRSFDVFGNAQCLIGALGVGDAQLIDHGSGKG